MLIPKIVPKEDRQQMLALFERYARAKRANQIGANHVLQVILDEGYYRRFGEGLQGGQNTDVPRDMEIEWNHVLNADHDSPPPTIWGEWTRS